MKFLLRFWMRVFYIIMKGFVFKKWGIIRKTSSTTVTIFLSHVIKHMQQMFCFVCFFMLGGEP